MNPHELKSLQTRLAKAKAVYSEKKESAANAQREQSQALALVKELEDRIKSATKEPVVTEHALLRYVERVCGIDLDAIRADILNERNVKAIKVLGSGRYPLNNGCMAVVKGMTVVSIVDK